jgi:hypothetical protein
MCKEKQEKRKKGHRSSLKQYYLIFRHSNSNSLGIAVANADNHGFDACKLSSFGGRSVKL